jgi:DNA-directed RNA polymerase subunit RPC12/RpoP
MVRCDEFYEKWERCGNFCEVHPTVAASIEKYLNKILPLIEAERLKSGIPEMSNVSSSHILSQGSAKLIQKRMGLDVQKAIAHDVVAKAEQNVVDGKTPVVTSSEVAAIVRRHYDCSDLPNKQLNPGCSRPNKREFGCVDCQIGFKLYTPEAAIYCPVCGGNRVVNLKYKWTVGCAVVIDD